MKKEFPFYYTKEEIPYENWNAIWESNFKPVLVDDFCVIRADFHEPLEGYEHEIIINPKMAFGTGHHETSFMMLQLMRNMDFFNKQILDYGAGTGILSIMAAYKGAKSIIAVDIEKESYLNTIENANRNKVTNITSVHGTLDSIPEKSTYDIILANINRKVLLDSAKDLVFHCRKPAVLLISGILRVDIDFVRKAYQDINFEFKEMMFKGEWVAMKFHFGNELGEFNIVGDSIK